MISIFLLSLFSSHPFFYSLSNTRIQCIVRVKPRGGEESEKNFAMQGPRNKGTCISHGC